MATICVPNDGKVAILDRIVPGISTFYHLFTAPGVVGPDTHLVDFVEATFSGYAPVLVSAWGPAFLNTDVPRGISMGDPALFTKSGATGETGILGYYVTTSSGGGLLLWACVFDLARDMLVDGERIVIAPELDCISIFHNS